MAKTLTTPIVVPEAIRRKAGLRPGQPVEFRVSGKSITIVPKDPSGDYPMETVLRLVKEAKRRPMSPAEAKALDAELRTYGAQRAKKISIKESDIVRIVHESRARRRTP